MIETVILVLLIIMAVAAVMTNSLLRTIIYAEVFSLIMALLFLYYNAPDVALAEAAIGVALSTIMYLVALKKVQMYDICYVDESAIRFNDDNIHTIQNKFLKSLERFIEQSEELEPRITYSNYDFSTILEDEHDIIVRKIEDSFYFYGKSTDVVFQDIVENIYDHMDSSEEIRIIYVDQEVSLNDPF